MADATNAPIASATVISVGPPDHSTIPVADGRVPITSDTDIKTKSGSGTRWFEFEVFVQQITGGCVARGFAAFYFEDRNEAQDNELTVHCNTEHTPIDNGHYEIVVTVKADTDKGRVVLDRKKQRYEVV